MNMCSAPAPWLNTNSSSLAAADNKLGDNKKQLAVSITTPTFGTFPHLCWVEGGDIYPVGEMHMRVPYWSTGT